MKKKLAAAFVILTLSAPAMAAGLGNNPGAGGFDNFTWCPGPGDNGKSPFVGYFRYPCFAAANAAHDWAE